MEEIKHIKTGKDLNWFSENFSKEDMDEHAGEWIAVKDERVLSSGEDFREVLKLAKEKVVNPLLIKIPKRNEILGVS